jgi:hypothetical protein
MFYINLLITVLVFSAEIQSSKTDQGIVKSSQEQVFKTISTLIKKANIAPQEEEALFVLVKCQFEILVADAVGMNFGSTADIWKKIKDHLNSEHTGLKLKPSVDFITQSIDRIMYQNNIVSISEISQQRTVEVEVSKKDKLKVGSWINPAIRQSLEYHLSFNVQSLPKIGSLAPGKLKEIHLQNMKILAGDLQKCSQNTNSVWLGSTLINVCSNLYTMVNQGYAEDERIGQPVINMDGVAILAQSIVDINEVLMKNKSSSLWVDSADVKFTENLLSAIREKKQQRCQTKLLIQKKASLEKNEQSFEQAEIQRKELEEREQKRQQGQIDKQRAIENDLKTKKIKCFCSDEESNRAAFDQEYNLCLLQLEKLSQNYKHLINIFSALEKQQDEFLLNDEFLLDTDKSFDRYRDVQGVKKANFEHAMMRNLASARQEKNSFQRDNAVFWKNMWRLKELLRQNEIMSKAVQGDKCQLLVVDGTGMLNRLSELARSSVYQEEEAEFLELQNDKAIDLTRVPWRERNRPQDIGKFLNRKVKRT